ncbi:MAG: sigma-70 family RNA polymerase sigma factor [Bacteroidetes bacterium]|jgi:RNA polymerase sigma factor (sigma-70 family)|nr:MAG: sigma-70 family RNA polymerase sigma factor [Bacteroidota bacterium]
MKEGSVKLEKELLQGLQQNHEEALASLMKMYYANLYNYGARFTKDDGLIKDCIQEVFISLWQRRETAESILSPRYYFLRAIKNKVLKAIHKNVDKISSADLQGEYDFFHDFSIEQVIAEKQVSKEKAIKLRNVLSLLSKKQKEIIYLKYYQYLDHGQIAELMNISRQSVYNLLHEVIHKLRSLWHTGSVVH